MRRSGWVSRPDLMREYRIICRLWSGLLLLPRRQSLRIGKHLRYWFKDQIRGD